MKTLLITLLSLMLITGLKSQTFSLESKTKTIIVPNKKIEKVKCVSKFILDFPTNTITLIENNLIFIFQVLSSEVINETVSAKCIDFNKDSFKFIFQSINENTKIIIAMDSATFVIYNGKLEKIEK